MRGCNDSWSKLTLIYGPVVYGWIRRLGFTPDDAQDVLQEVFIAVYRGLSTYDRSRGRFRHWLYGLTRNAAVDFLRRRRGQKPGEGGTTAFRRHQEAADPVPPDVDSPFVPTVIVRKTLELLRVRFQEKTWTAAWHILIDGIDPATVAVELEMSLSSVYTAKSRVLTCLREELRDFEG